MKQLTPKEQADKILYDFIELSDEAQTYHIIPIQSDAKLAEMLCVDNIIRAYPHTYDTEIDYTKDQKIEFTIIKNIRPNVEYWTKVREELEKL